MSFPVAMSTRSAALLVLTLGVWIAGCSNYVPGDATYNLGHPEQARETYETNYKAGSNAAGLRLGEMYLAGLGGTDDLERAIAINKDLAAKGVVAAEHNLGYCYEYGRGIIDYNQAAIWYGKAAQHRYVPAMYNLGTLYAKERLLPGNDVEGLTLLLEASELAEGISGEKARFIREDPPGHRLRMVHRMSAADVNRARKQAKERAAEFRRKGTDQNFTSQQQLPTSQP